MCYLSFLELSEGIAVTYAGICSIFYNLFYIVFTLQRESAVKKKHETDPTNNLRLTGSTSLTRDVMYLTSSAENVLGESCGRSSYHVLNKQLERTMIHVEYITDISHFLSWRHLNDC